eukprot:2610270-Prymnesium_polylepis.1
MVRTSYGAQRQRCKLYDRSLQKGPSGKGKPTGCKHEFAHQACELEGMGALGRPQLAPPRKPIVEHRHRF